MNLYEIKADMVSLQCKTVWSIYLSASEARFSRFTQEIWGDGRGQLNGCYHYKWWRRLVNTYEIKVGMVKGRWRLVTVALSAPYKYSYLLTLWCICSVKTVWSIHERFRGEVLTMGRYTNLRIPLRSLSPFCTYAMKLEPKQCNRQIFDHMELLIFMSTTAN